MFAAVLSLMELGKYFNAEEIDRREYKSREDINEEQREEEERVKSIFPAFMCHIMPSEMYKLI